MSKMSLNLSLTSEEHVLSRLLVLFNLGQFIPRIRNKPLRVKKELLSQIKDLSKKSYRQMALKYHPDRNPGREKEAAQAFDGINQCYTVLQNFEFIEEVDVECPACKGRGAIRRKVQ